MAELEPLTSEQLDELSDDELEQRVADERMEELGSDNQDDSEVEDTEDVADQADEEDLDTEDVDDDSEVEAGDEVDENEADTSTNGEDNPDGETEPREDKPDAKLEETPTFRDLKVNGTMMPINSLDELYALASGGGHMTQQLQGLSKRKKSLSIMDSQNISDEDLSILAQIKGGNKDALATLVKSSGIDYMDITDEVGEGYTTQEFIPSDTAMNLKEVQDSISMDPEYAITQNIVNNLMDERSQDMLIENPNYIKGLHTDVKSGAYEPTQAQAMKLKMMDGGAKSDMDYYIQAAQGVPQGQPQQQQMQQPERPQTTRRSESVKSKKRSGASIKSKTPPASRPNVNDMSDDELMAYREEIMSR